MDQESEYSSESLAKFYRDWDKVTDRFFPPAKRQPNARLTWAQAVQQGKEREFLKSEGEGD